MKFSRAMVHVCILVTFSVVPFQRAFTQKEQADIAAGAKQYRDSIATAMQQAAKKSHVPIDTSKTVITTRDDIVIAVAPIIDKRLEEGEPKPDEPVKLHKVPILFAYISFAGNASASASECAARLFKSGAKSDFFVVEVDTAPASGQPEARYINSRGETAVVAKLEAQHRKARDDDGKGPQLGIQLRHADRSGEHKEVFTTVIGTCRCQRVGLFCWRRLHTVII